MSIENKIEGIIPHGQFCTKFHCYCKTRKIKIKAILELFKEKGEEISTLKEQLKEKNEKLRGEAKMAITINQKLIDYSQENTKLKEQIAKKDEALKKIVGKYVDPPKVGGQYTDREILLWLAIGVMRSEAAQALKGEKPDPSRAELIELVKEAHHHLKDNIWVSETEFLKNLQACIKKLEGE